MTDTTKRGYYVFASGRWLPYKGVPCVHLAYPHEKYAVLTSDFGYRDSQDRWHVATIGFPFDGISTIRPIWFLTGHPWGRNLPAAVIHDSERAIARTLPPGPERDALLYGSDVTFRDGLECLGNSWLVQQAWYRVVRAHAVTVDSRATVVPDYREFLLLYYQDLGLKDDFVWMQMRRNSKSAVAIGD